MTGRVLGIDPGLRVTGYGVVERSGNGYRLIEAGIVSPTRGLDLEMRLNELHRGICDVIATTQPTCLVIEELYSTYKNPMTAILMGHARGVLCLAGAQNNIPVHTLGHSLVKRAMVGSGTATKDMVNAMVTQLLGLRKAPEPNDVSDALALSIAFLNMHARVATAALLLGSAPSRSQKPA
jgi:crossover junction endodeoxyribonuclease RuvC